MRALTRGIISAGTGNSVCDGGDGLASVKMKAADKKIGEAMAKRTASNPDSNPLTGVDLGVGPDAGTVTPSKKAS